MSKQLIGNTCFMYHDDLAKAEDGKPLSVFWWEGDNDQEYVHISVLKEAIALCNLKAEVIPMDGGDLDGGGRCCVVADGIMSDVDIHNLWAWLRWHQGDNP